MTSGRDSMLSGLDEAWRQAEMERVRRQRFNLPSSEVGTNPFHARPMGQVDQLGKGDWARESHMRSFVKSMEQKFEAHRQQTQQVIERLATEVNDLRSMYDYIYRHHPEVIKEYDVIQRTKERLNVEGK